MPGWEFSGCSGILGIQRVPRLCTAQGGAVRLGEHCCAFLLSALRSSDLKKSNFSLFLLGIWENHSNSSSSSQCFQQTRLIPDPSLRTPPGAAGMGLGVPAGQEVEPLLSPSGVFGFPWHIPALPEWEVNILQAGTGSCLRPGQHGKTITASSTLMWRIISTDAARNKFCCAGRALAVRCSSFLFVFLLAS